MHVDIRCECNQDSDLRNCELNIRVLVLRRRTDSFKTELHRAQYIHINLNKKHLQSIAIRATYQRIPVVNHLIHILILI